MLDGSTTVVVPNWLIWLAIVYVAVRLVFDIKFSYEITRSIVRVPPVDPPASDDVR